MDKCPSCGSLLVWLYGDGVIVCSGCGVVVDRIIDYSPVYADENEEINRLLRLRNRPRYNSVEHRVIRKRKLYNAAEKRIRGKYWLVVDYDKFLTTGRFINTIKHRASIEAERNVEKLGLSSIIEEGLSILRKRDPSLLCRSGRGKLALAYIAAKLVKEGFPPPEEEVMKIFNISSTSYKRLLDALKNSEKRTVSIAYG
ncbi:MAG: TFIIB-type zinc ribbon-containing protein [Desulfurococcaceae archaeon]